MPYIIAAGTQVSGFGFDSSGGLPGQIGTGDRGLQSISLSTSVTPNRLWHLGHITPYDENIIIQKQLNITCYGGASPLYETEASLGCTEPPALNIRISANSCNSTIFEDTTEWFLNNYSYNKDVQEWGSETWSFTSKPILLDENRQPVVDVDIIMIRGIAEGEKTTDGGADPGILFIPGTTIINKDTIPALDFIGTVEVSQGNPGIGRAHDMEYGVVSQVGQGTGKSPGKDGRGSVTIPYTPLYT